MQLTELQMDFFKETFNIGVGKGARVLNTMLSTHITLSIPEIQIVDSHYQNTTPHDDASVATVALDFDGQLKGSCQLLFPTESAMNLVNCVTGDMGDEVESDFDAMSEGVLKEIGNIVLNSVMGVLGNTLAIELIYTVPTFRDCEIQDLIKSNFDGGQSVGLIARINFHIESIDVRGEVLTIFNLGSFNHLMDQVDKILDV